MGGTSSAQSSQNKVANVLDPYRGSGTGCGAVFGSKVGNKTKRFIVPVSGSAWVRGARRFEAVLFKQEKHPIFCIYRNNDDLKDDTTNVLLIDMVHTVRPGLEHLGKEELAKVSKKTLVRYGLKTVGQIGHLEEVDGTELHNLDPDFKALEEFCARYQIEHPNYSIVFNNCRKFMRELYNLLGHSFNDLPWYEDLLYVVSNTSATVGTGLT